MVVAGVFVQPNDRLRQRINDDDDDDDDVNHLFCNISITHVDLAVFIGAVLNQSVTIMTPPSIFGRAISTYTGVNFFDKQYLQWLIMRIDVN